MVLNKLQPLRGFSLVEVLIVAAVLSIFFGGLFLTVQLSARLVSDNRSRLTALTVASDQMEYIRSLSFDAVGTLAGIPLGTISQVSTTTLNNQTFVKTVLIEYVDDSADGIGSADSNAILTDYKRAKVTVAWINRGVANEIFLVSNIVPRSIESNIGGGTIRVNVFDALVRPLPGADVRLYRTIGTSTIDVTKSTDATGIALFSGAPAGSDYQISVTAPGYSIDQTYQATSSLPNPTTLPVTVLQADITTMNFFIDRLGAADVRTLASKTIRDVLMPLTLINEFSTTSNLSLSSSTLVLRSVSGSYVASGTAFMLPITPSPLQQWSLITPVTTTPINTSYKFSLYTGTSTFTLLPDSDLPGNALGFGGVVDISALNVATYPSLVIGLVLTTTNPAVTPAVDSLTLRYKEVETTQSSVSVTFRGTKTIGTLADTTSVYKTTRAFNTNGSGSASVPSLEWDSYNVSVSGYDISEICSVDPVVISPGTTASVDIVTVANSTNSLRVVVKNSSGATITGAVVELRRGSSLTQTTSICGQTFFSDLTAADYELTVSAPGYTDVVIDPLSIAGDVVQRISL